MGKTLIIYSSRYGCTKRCAEEIQRKLGGDLVHVTSQTVSDIGSYDQVVIGSSIYIGQTGRALKTFLRKYTEEMKGKKVGIFLCCGFPDEQESYFEHNFPSELLEQAEVKLVFGGEVRGEGMKFMDRAIASVVKKKIGEFPVVDQEAIRQFVEQMAQV